MEVEVVVRTHLSAYTLLSFPQREAQLILRLVTFWGQQNFFGKGSESKYFRFCQLRGKTGVQIQCSHLHGRSMVSLSRNAFPCFSLKHSDLSSWELTTTTTCISL